MALLEIRFDLARLVTVLERIATVLERVYPPPKEGAPKPMRFLSVDPAVIAEAEEEADRKREAGTENT